MEEENKETEPIKKKRGRKKKWETTTFKNNYVTNTKDAIKFEEMHNVDEDKYITNALNFGNLCIKIHDKEAEPKQDIANFFKDTVKKECEIYLSSDEEDTCNFKKETKHQIKHFSNSYEINSLKINNKQCRCYNCHYDFLNPPFFLPIEYSPTLDRYKLFGNFCSPNCVKSFCLDNKTFKNKSYLVGQFYRKLFGPNFRINPAPSIFNLKDYGGKLTIEEFRKSFYSNSRYIINNINTKIIYVN